MERGQRLERAERALHEREIAFAALAKVAPVGIMRFDAEGRCNYINDRWGQISGLSIDDALGNGWQRAVHPEDRPEVIHRWNLLRLQEENFREEYRVCRPDGTVRWVLAEGVPLRSYSGRLLGFIRAVTDITTHRQLETELSAARVELEDRVRERTAELEAQIGERQKLEKEVLEAKDDEQRRFSQDLHDGLGQHLVGMEFRLSALVDDLTAAQSPLAQAAGEILDLVKDAGKQAHNLARGAHPVSLRPDGLMTALEELVEKLCRSTKIQCHFECEEPVHLADNATATHLYRIAQEAITNAIKHGRAKKITLRLRAEKGMIELTIKDHGRGFAVDRLSAAGRGLNIMRHRAHLIDGQIEVFSSAGAGTTIRCRCPAKE